MNKRSSKKSLQMKWLEKAECWVTSSMTLVLHISRILGIAPVWFKKLRGTRQISVSQAMCFYSFMVTTLINAALITGLIFDLRTDMSHAVRGRSTAKRVSWVATLAILIVSVSVCGYRAPARIKAMIQCMDRIQKINSLMVNKSKTTSNEGIRCLVLVIIIIVYIFVAACDYWIWLQQTMSGKRNLFTAYLYSAIYIANFIMVLMMLQFILSALEVHSTLKMMNEILEQFLLPRPLDTKRVYVKLSNGITNRVHKSLDETIPHLTAMYGTVYDVMERLDATNGLCIVLLFTSCIFDLIFTTYIFIVNLSNVNVSEFQKITPLNWCLLQFFWILATVEPCNMTQLEMDRSSTLVTKLAIKHNDEVSIYELEKFSRYLLLNKVTYSPLGICTLSRSLIVTIMATVTTYLVIVIQIPNLDDNRI